MVASPREEVSTAATSGSGGEPPGNDDHVVLVAAVLGKVGTAAGDQMQPRGPGPGEDGRQVEEGLR